VELKTLKIDIVLRNITHEDIQFLTAFMAGMKEHEKKK